MHILAVTRPLDKYPKQKLIDVRCQGIYSILTVMQSGIDQPFATIKGKMGVASFYFTLFSQRQGRSEAGGDVSDTLVASRYSYPSLFRIT